MPDYPVCDVEECGQVASWELDVPDEGKLLLCQAHNDFDLQHNENPAPRKGVWEGMEREETTVEQSAYDPKFSIGDLQGYLLQLVAKTGVPEAILWKIAGVSVRYYLDSCDRWERLETDAREARAPLWLSRGELAKLTTMLRGERSVEGRLIRQEIQRILDA